VVFLKKINFQTSKCNKAWPSVFGFFFCKTPCCKQNFEQDWCQISFWHAMLLLSQGLFYVSNMFRTEMWSFCPFYNFMKVVYCNPLY